MSASRSAKGHDFGKPSHAVKRLPLQWMMRRTCGPLSSRLESLDSQSFPRRANSRNERHLASALS